MLERLSRVVAVTGMIALMIGVFLSVLFRFFGSTFLGGVDNVAGFLLLMIGIGGAASAVRAGSFIRIGTFTDGKPWRPIVNKVNLAIALIYVGLLAYVSIEGLSAAYTQRILSIGLWQISLTWPYLVLAIGMLLLVAEIAVELVGRARPDE